MHCLQWSSKRDTGLLLRQHELKAGLNAALLCGVLSHGRFGLCLFLGCSDSRDLTIETLEKQYELVKRRTSNNYTYNQGSHVMQFGDLVIDEEPAADYLGGANTGQKLNLLCLRKGSFCQSIVEGSAIKSRLVEDYLWWASLRPTSQLWSEPKPVLCDSNQASSRRRVWARLDTARRRLCQQSERHPACRGRPAFRAAARCGVAAPLDRIPTRCAGRAQGGGACPLERRNHSACQGRRCDPQRSSRPS